MKPFPLFTALLAMLLTACTPAATEKKPAPAPSQSPSQAHSINITTSAVSVPAALPFQQTVWGWQYTLLNTQLSTLQNGGPGRYTLTFLEENRLAIVADCNRGGTVYRVQGDLLTFEPIAMTKMLCPADSLDRDFLDGLHAVERYRIDDKALTLQLRQGGEMVFAPLQP